MQFFIIYKILCHKFRVEDCVSEYSSVSEYSIHDCAFLISNVFVWKLFFYVSSWFTISVIFEKTVTRMLKWCYYFRLQSYCKCLEIQILGSKVSRRQSIRWANGSKGYEIHNNVSSFTMNEDFGRNAIIFSYDIFVSDLFEYFNSRDETFLLLGSLRSWSDFWSRLNHTDIILIKVVILTLFFFPPLVEGSLSSTNVPPLSSLCHNVHLIDWSFTSVSSHFTISFQSQR